ncbi:hypothetical protein [Legionella bononiensis]|uniref:Uncharacterized protein n=1 Tax=Legionella bononiensis TaxID=2793102 RepID=A0ABS1W7V0_9GAMM|nr:hypothetical protein [Legionella bononiensis]MBL7480044.1 hypothetical protein [Legionella bononiensis]MBL7525442.1 hypothetical protein [Legionella bononiensis]MBL7561625.1 hypothetical protein [Legionella bononiensis]
MTFKDWCYEALGIVEFTEGKILNCIFIPALPKNSLKSFSLVEWAGGYPVNVSNMSGIIIPYDNYLVLMDSLQNIFWNSRLFQQTYQEWLNQFFLNLGVDLTQMREYKDFSSIHLTFNTPQSQINFISRFNFLYPIVSYNPILRTESLQLPATIIRYLLTLYYQDPVAEIKNSRNYSVMQNHLDNLRQLKQLIEHHNLQIRLDYSMMLARDFSNSIRNGIRLSPTHAASAYSLSLKIYAEVNRDNLTTVQYEELNYAASLLAAYTPEGKLRQSLKTDTKFIKYLHEQFKVPNLNGQLAQMPLLKHLAEPEQNLISSLIEQNLNAMLYGCPFISIGYGSYISMLRFLPGRQMQSDTDELIFQGGGMRGHAAVFRIIKIGFLADGVRAEFNEKPFFYEYYKVEDNLGDGYHELNLYEKTCTGTYVTQLEPYTIKDGVFIRLKLDPFTQPVEYQNAMEFTLKELIRVERLIKFYRKPSYSAISPDFSSPDSDEANEWIRLNEIRLFLSGRAHPYPLVYYSKDPLNPSIGHRRTVCNRRGFYQEGGSCPVFSLKSLVNGVIGSELMTLHNNFMQLNNSRHYMRSIECKIALLHYFLSRLGQSQKASMTPAPNLITPEEKPTVSGATVQYRVSFFSENQSEPVLSSHKEVRKTGFRM